MAYIVKFEKEMMCDMDGEPYVFENVNEAKDWLIEINNDYQKVSNQYSIEEIKDETVLMTPEIEKLVKKYPLMSQDESGEDAVIIASYYHPISNWSWYATEGKKMENGDYEFFGYVKGNYNEYGYFRLSELAEVKVTGMPVIRDMWFKIGKTTLKEVVE